MSDIDEAEFAARLKTVAPVVDEPGAWEAVLAAAGRQRRRHRVAVLALSSCFLAAVAAGGVLLSQQAGDERVPVAAGEREGELVEVEEPVDEHLAAEAIQSLETCETPVGRNRFEQAAVTLPLLPVGAGAPVDVPVAEVLAVLPMPRELADVGCVATGARGEAYAWEYRTANGDVIAWAVGAPHQGQGVPNAVGEPYFQEYISSGQHFNGVIDSGRGKALVGGTLAVFDLSLLDLDGRDLLAALTLATLSNVPPADAAGLPRRMAPGYIRCTVPYRKASGDSIHTDYCSAEGTRIVVVRTSDPSRFEEGRVIGERDVAGQQASIREIPDGRLAVVARAAGREHVVLVAPSAVGADTLARIAASIPLLDPHLLNPSRGTTSATADWTATRAHQVLVDAGFSSIELTAPDPPQFSVTFPGGARGSVVLQVAPPGISVAPPGYAESYKTFRTVDILLARSGSQAMAICGGLFINVMDDSHWGATHDRDLGQPYDKEAAAQTAAAEQVIAIIETLGCADPTATE